jgi:hypothetical protein
MLTTFALLAMGVLVRAENASDNDGLVWRLGIQDGNSGEFVPYNSGEFRTSKRILDSAGYRREQKLFIYEVPSTGGVIAKPEMPGGISGGHHAGNNTLVTQQEIVWNESLGGWRELEMRLLPGPRDLREHRLRPNENMDIDGTDIVKPALRVEFPDGQAYYRELPADLEMHVQRHGPMVIRASFKAAPGICRIKLTETSGETYGRVYGFDYLELKETDHPVALPPVVEYQSGNGFLADNVFDHRQPAELEIVFRNLQPEKEYLARVDWVNYFNHVSRRETLVLTGTGCPIARTLSCPQGETGHFRVHTTVTEAGRPLALQMGEDRAEIRLAAVRMIAPLSDAEIDGSFIGLCGQGQSSYFDPLTYPPQAQVLAYRNYRRILQIHHERVHSLQWQFLEREEGKFDWDYWDWLLAGEKEDRMRVQLGVLGTPEWLFRRHYPERETSHPRHIYFSVPPDMEKWAATCAMIARRYHGTVAEMGIWNEPSEQSIFWHQGTAEDYFTLVKVAAAAIREANPDMKIVAETVWARQLDFSARLYELGIGKYIDHPADHYMNDDRIRMVNRLLAKYGANQGLLCTEAKCDRSSPLGQIDEPSRRQAARDLFRNYLFYHANGIARTYNFELLSRTWRLFGMIGPDHTPKYTFAAMKTLANRFAGTEIHRTYDVAAGIETYAYRYVSPVRIRENGGDSILALVNREAEPQEMNLFVGRPNVTLIDLMDNARELDAPNGIVRVTVGADPVMLVGADLEAMDLASCLQAELTAGGDADRQLELQLHLAAQPQLQRATVTAILDCPVPLAAEPAELHPGQDTTIRMTLPPELRDGHYRLNLKATLHTERGEIPVERSIAVIVAKIPVGENVLPPWSDQEKAWSPWGDIQVEYPTAATVKATVKDTGGLTCTAPIAVIPGQPYHLAVKARGQGMFRVMIETLDDQGSTLAKTHNFLAEAMGESWTSLAAEWTPPRETGYVRLHWYQWQTDGWFEIEAASLVRLRPRTPVNRQLFVMPVPQRKNIVVDGQFDDWADAPWLEIKDRVGDITDGFRARCSAAWNDGTVYLAVEVTDSGHHPRGGADLWNGDSVQVDFDPGNNNSAVPSAQFGFADGSIYRYSVIPTEDIVESYKLGPAPAGTSAVVTRKDKVTRYEIAIAASAIWPNFDLRAGTSCGFSLLVNNSDETGRKGWIQWSSGIGSFRDSTLFGRMIFAD